MKKIRKDIKRTKKIIGGNDNKILETKKEGSTKGNYLNENYSTDIPYVKDYIPELDKDTIKEKIEDYKKKTENALIDYKQSMIDYNIEKKEKQIEKGRKEIIDEKRYAVDSKINDAVSSRNFKALTGIASFTAVTSKEFFAGFIKYFYKFFGNFINFSKDRIKDIFNAINTPIIIKHVIPIIVIICAILFILYILGFKLNTGNAPNAPNGTPIIPNSGISVAEKKPEYIKDESYFDKLMKLILTMPIFRSLLAKYNELSNNISKSAGGVDSLDEYSINRNTINEGRNDNIYNIKLAKYFRKNDNNVYSIIVPTELEIKYEDVKEFLTDFNKLPENIKNNILKNKEVIKFKWDLENNKYIMRCNNIKDSTGKSVDNLYGDCSKKKLYNNVSYNKPRERLEYNTLNKFVPLFKN